MLFNSYIFIFIFLPLALLGYFTLNHFKKFELSKLFLAGMSLWFYAYFDIYYLWVIVGSILVNYLFSYIIQRFYSSKGELSLTVKRLFVVIGVLINLGLLFYFKYLDFFIENINALVGSHFRLHNILLPLGISFFSFQQMSFIIDRARGKAEHYSFINYITFVTFFPQLIAGPIVLYTEMMPQFESEQNKHFRFDNFSKGTILFTLGLSKKVLLADVLAQSVNYGFANAIFLDTTSTVLMMLAYTFQIYFDFSGYSDMAMGLGYMFNIELPVNFNSPYKACSVKELWQRWHMTLSRFFIQYVYIPLGGSRNGRFRTLINIFLVFFFSGIWHGANWTYIAWGTMQGLLVVWDNLGIIGVKGSNDKIKAHFQMPRPLGWLLTFSFFNLSLLFFGSDSMKTAFQMFKNLFAFTNTGHVYKLANSTKITELYFITKACDLKFPEYSNILSLIIYVVFLFICGLIIKGKNALEITKETTFSRKTYILTAILLAWNIISFSQVSTFIYFNF